MGLNIIKSTEPIEIKQVKILVYGQPGIGKSSIAFTAKNPICLDFDKGAHRSQNRGDIVDITDWEDVAKISKEDLKGYDTVIIDTLGRCLDFISNHVIKGSGMAKKDGLPTMAGYTTIKNTFIKWTKQLTVIGKDIVMVAHEREEKDGDSRIVRADLSLSTYNEIIKIIDFIGYQYFHNNQIILDFNLTEKYIGKNSCGFPPLQVPDFKVEPDYMTKLIASMKSSLGKSANSQLKSEDIVKSYKEKIDALLNVEQYNTLMENVKDLFRAGKIPEFEQVKELLKTKASNNNIEFDTKEKCFVPKPEPEPVQEPVTSPIDVDMGF